MFQLGKKNNLQFVVVSFEYLFLISEQKVEEKKIYSVIESGKVI